MPADGCERGRCGERADAAHCLYALRTGWRFDTSELFCRNGLDREAELVRQRNQHRRISLVAGGCQNVEPATAAGRNPRFAQRIDVWFSAKAEAADPRFTALHWMTGPTPSQAPKPPSRAPGAL